MSFSHKPPKQQGEDQRDFDTTSLRQNHHGGFIHRDYGAHFFRWGFASKMIKGGDRVLDLGCGADQPLARILCYKPSGLPSELVGVDYGNVKPKFNPKWFTLYPNFDFTKRWPELDTFDVICCFEVIEHMQKSHGRKLLKGIKSCLRPDGKVLLSTPVFDAKTGMAQNHIHEYGIEELQKEIEKAGLKVEHRYGTFMTVLQMKHTAPEHQATWKALREYYSDDVLACFLAPLYPDRARNNFWVLRHA